MKAPMSWFSDYMDMSGIDPKQFAHGMTMTGSMVEGMENAGHELTNVVVGRVVSVENHPDADKLKVCMIDVGEETLQIVTGAENITSESVGSLVPVAKHKSTLPGGIKITKGKLRGVESFGMLCSHKELGFSDADFPDAPYGILILDTDLKPGTDIREVFGLNENVAEFEITSNRPDCLSIIGLAREAALTFDREFKIPEVKVSSPCSDKTEDIIKVTVEDTEGCPRYLCRGVKNVKIAPSPVWLARRLRDAGVRPINNIVDITNYVMLEYGQPMHAFDVSYLEGGEINVRRAKDNEKMVTLDEQERVLDSSILVIADKNKAVAVAGVMGALNSEIQPDTGTVLFESANFNPAIVRNGAKKLGLRTESSSRFEKGLDANNTINALNRACQLVEELGAGEVMTGMVDVNNDKTEKTVIKFRPDKIGAFLGIYMSREDMESILKKLEFEITENSVIPPSYRKDIESEADVSEEIARFYGYEKIPSTMLFGETTQAVKTKKQKIEEITQNTLTCAGMYEVATYTFTSPKIFDRLNISKGSKLRDVVVITNPLGEDNSIMRTITLAEMMEVVSRNINFRAEEGMFFEIGKIYNPKDAEMKELPLETNMLTTAIYGAKCDFFTLKGILEKLFFVLGIKKCTFEAISDYTPMHPGRCAKVSVNGKEIGVIGEMHPTVLKNYGISGRVYMSELNFDIIAQEASFETTYKQLPKYPAVTRDIAVLVEETVPVAKIYEVIEKCSGNLFEGAKLFDVYQGDQVAKGYKSVAYSVSFRAADRTLVDDEVNAAFNKILKGLKETLKAELR